MMQQQLPELELADLFGLESVLVQNVPALVCENGHDPIVPGPVVDALSKQVVVQMLTGNYPLGGMEVRFLRKAMALTQQRLADLLGVDRVTVARWEALEEEHVDMPVSIALRTVLAASERSPLRESNPNAASYREPPAPHPSRFVLEAPPQSAVGF